MSNFWKMAEITSDLIVKETEVYMVVITPTLWRQLARSETDRNLGEFSVVNKLYGTVESSANNLPLAVQTMKSLQDAYDDLVKKGTRNEATVIEFCKNRPE